MLPINIITPWPSQRNGIADYSYELSKHTRRPHYVVTECINPASGAEMAEVVHPNDTGTAALLSHGTNIFHFGNNPDHTFAVPLFLKYGGFAVVHDLSLHYLAELSDFLVPGFFQHVLQLEQPDIAHRLMKLWKTSGKKIRSDYKEINMLSWLASARGLIVHSDYAANIIRSYNSSSKIHVVPHFAYQLVPDEEKIAARVSAFRRKYGLNDNTFVISAAGFVTENKQYGSILRAISSLPTDVRANLRFVIAGEKRIREYDIDKEVRKSGLAESVIFTDFLDENALTELLIASDLVMNLRYPTFGESSGSVARALGCGSVVIVSDSGSYSELPDEVCFKVSAQRDPYFELSNIIRLCLSRPDFVHAKRRAILKYARQSLHPEAIAQRYAHIVSTQ